MRGRLVSRTSFVSNVVRVGVVVHRLVLTLRAPGISAARASSAPSLRESAIRRRPWIKSSGRRAPPLQSLRTTPIKWVDKWGHGVSIEGAGLGEG